MIASPLWFEVSDSKDMEGVSCAEIFKADGPDL